MIKTIDSNTYQKVYTILNDLNLFFNLPKEIQELIKNNRNSNYLFEYNKDIPIEIQIYDKETMAVLSYLCLKYISKNSKVNTRMLDRYKINESNEQIDKYNKYPIEDLFKNKKINNSKITEDNILALTEIKHENRFIKFIKKLFRIK